MVENDGISVCMCVDHNLTPQSRIGCETEAIAPPYTPPDRSAEREMMMKMRLKMMRMRIRLMKIRLRGGLHRMIGDLGERWGDSSFHAISHTPPPSPPPM